MKVSMNVRSWAVDPARHVRRTPSEQSPDQSYTRVLIDAGRPSARPRSVLIARRLGPGRPAVAAFRDAADAVFLHAVRRTATVVHQQAVAGVDHRDPDVSRSLPGLVEPDGHAGGNGLVKFQGRVVEPLDQQPVDEQLAARAEFDRRLGRGDRRAGRRFGGDGDRDDQGNGRKTSRDRPH
jgi:hypothetical protein